MDDDAEPSAPSSKGARGAPAGGGEAATMGPVYLMWESSLEKLKILGYEKDYCKKHHKNPFNRVHFAIPGANSSHQFDDFVTICSWLCTDISRKTDVFKPEEFDDPNTIVNKLLLALRNFDFRSSFPAQKLKTAHGEPVCTVLEFLTDKALDARGFKWGVPIYATADDVEQAADPDADEDDIVEEEEAVGIEDDVLFEEPNRLDASLDTSAHHILQAAVDPVEWKTELERVAPKLRANLQLTTNEWRSHVDQTVTSKGHIEKVLGETQGDLQIMNKHVADELNRMRIKEKYLNNQYNSLGLEFIEVKHKLEELETKGTLAHDSVAKLTNDLAEITEKLEDIKDSFESKDSGLHDTSPLVKIKAALQQIKAEIHGFDMRIGVVSHSLLAARVADTNRQRAANVTKTKQRHSKHRKQTSNDDNSLPSDD